MYFMYMGVCEIHPYCYEINVHNFLTLQKRNNTPLTILCFLFLSTPDNCPVPSFHMNFMKLVAHTHGMIGFVVV